MVYAPAPSHETQTAERDLETDIRRFRKSCWQVGVVATLVIGNTAKAQVAGDLADVFGLDVDEARAAYEQAAEPSKLMTGLVLADLIGTSAPGGAIAQLDALRSESEHEHELAAAAYANAIRCAAFVRQARLEDAVPLCARAEGHLEAIEDPFLKARILASIQFLAIRQGKLREALEYAFEAEHWAAATGHAYVDATALNGIALTLAFSGLHEKAISKFEQAQLRLRGMEDRPLHKMIAFNLGVSLRESGSPESALDAFREGFEWAESTGQAHRAFIGRIEMANALGQLERWQESIELLGPALADRAVQRDPDSHMHALLAQSRAEIAIGNADDALRNLSTGLELARKHGNTRRLRQLTMARIEGLNAAGRIDEASAEAEVLVAELREARPNDELDAALYLLSGLQAQTGDYANAYQNLVEGNELTEASHGRSFARKLTLLEVADRLEFAERERQLAEERVLVLQEMVRKNQLINVAFGVALLLTAITAFLLWRNRKHALAALTHQLKSAELEEVVDRRNKALEDQFTYRMQDEEERQQLEEQLAETEKLRALGQLTGGIAHDFNNLMTVVSGATEMLESGPRMNDEAQKELVQAIRNATDTGQKITAGLLAYARKQKLSPEPVDLQEFLSSCRPLFQGTVGEEMRLQIASRPLRIVADRGQLTTAIINLLSNARDASSSRGTVTIEVEHLEEEAAAKLSVTDSGCGMSEEAVARATEPFYSTKETTLASGLGLSRVYGFAEQSGGRLEIDSKPGEGTVASLVFPITDDQAVTQEPRAAISGRRLHVLLVDDNTDVRSMVRKMLESFGHDVDTAASGERALEIMRETRPDLLVSDVLMPGEVSGRELAKAAREIHPDLPILMISGFVEAPDMEFPLLAKPFRVVELQSAIVQLFEDDATDGSGPGEA